ncbi:cytochrome C-type biogenesis protein [Aquipluma nitroreducens]|uniref:Cytochrome C-type biogenesis protein n=1 Tax=Aquipluma nitroreducens TaxID=2010828 RepID=A0A5K7SCA7_9BACT|nr:cytochrome c biogenesis protein CcsA [Aquipluma nitroreducens]BBE19222.1 cytochrome C-type biogenesis protein [Aquipluma nitroreducens]
MNKILNFLFSFPFMGFLLLVMAFSMGIATFVENYYGTEAAQNLIYKSFWFSSVLVLLAINLAVNFVRHKMYTRQRISVGIFHISFIIILIGAGITRYISFEGVMHIREGQTSDFILSSEDNLTVKSGNQIVSNPVLFSEITPNDFDENIVVEGRKVRIKSVGFIKNAVQTVKEDPSGKAMIDFVVSQGQGRENYVFSKGNILNLGNVQLGFEQPGANFQFIDRNGSLFLAADRTVEIRSMTGGETTVVNANDTIPVETMQLYAIDGYMLLVKNFYTHAISVVEKDPSGNEGIDAVTMEISDGPNKQTVNVMGKHGMRGEPFMVQVGNAKLEISYGADPIYLPFALQLTDFQMEKYPGSMSPSSYASELVLIDNERNVKRNVRVFMNNTLNYRGYKFFQSSYDQDEGGTVLSVNADQLGTTVTYLGYILLGLGFVLALFSKTSRFHSLVQRLKQYSKPVGLVVFALLFLNLGSAKADSSELSPIPRIDQAVLTDFSRLWIQEQDGRIEPVSTLSSEILRKVTRKSSFEGRSPEEVMLGLYLYPEYWRNVSLVYVTNNQLKSLLGVTESRIPLTALFDDKGAYKLMEPVKAAFAKMPASRNVYEKEIINLDERVNVCFMVINGDAFALFPGVTKDVKWAFPGNSPAGLTNEESLFVNKGFELLKEAMNGQGQISARQIMASIASYQTKYGSSYLPSNSKKEVEIFYNSLNPFKRVFPIYLLLGFTLLIVLFVNIFRQKNIGSKVRMGFTLLIVLGFMLQTFGLALRWYISGHAPWSNGYESMVYVAWASMLAGVIFGRKYPMVIATSAMLSGIILFVAHLNWMNPEITHLVPVLNSYWLMIHVAVITASYGFIGMSAFIGLLVLILFSLSNPKNSKNVKNIILQLTTISEMSVTVGLYMLTIGTFLGGVWANESWGRYWGWDSKETWALVTVVVYSFVAHMRLIPSLKGIYNYTVATVVGFSSVLMTYFGVNYYLSGLHSYGRGSIDGMHWSVYVFAGIVVALLISSNLKHKNLDFENTK